MTESAKQQRLITSEGLSKRAIGACWALSLVLLGSGVTATFMDKAGAAAATMLAMGGVLAILGLMKRIPLRLEVAGTKLDAAYPLDEAFDAGREDGVKKGLEIASNEVDKAESAGKSPEETVELIQTWFDRVVPGTQPALLPDPDQTRPNQDARTAGEIGYRGPTACRIAGITYRQLDYWARMGLVDPSIQPERGSTHRLYSFMDLVILKIVRRLLDTGVSLQQIRVVVAHLRSRRLDDLREVTLMSDGSSVYEATSADEVIDLVQGGQGIFGIAVGRVLKEVEGALP